MKEKKKVMIVDDVVANIHVLGTNLGADYEVLVATNGKRALALAESQLPDLILLDIMMPEMDGYTVCEKLKAHPLTRSIPVIFITAMNDPEDEAKGLEKGAIDYITKPFSGSIVKARVKNHIALKEFQDHLQHLSMMDGLTGIPNRRRFDEHVDQEWRRAVRARKPLSLLMMDIDFFKLYNDTYGHLKGDDCLRKVASTLKGSLNRPGDMVARYGGEEFICVLPDTDEEGALSMARAMQEAVNTLGIPHECSTVSEFVTLSMGVSSVIPTGDMVLADWIKQSDDLLYLAKQSGRNQIRGMGGMHPGSTGIETTIRWRDELLTGNDILDIQHRELIERISRVLEDVKSPNGAGAAKNIDCLLDYVFDHFALEEKLMIQTAYPHFEEHLEEHSYYVKYINKLKRRKVITREMIAEMQSTLSKWFFDHIIGEDRKMAAHLKQYCRNASSHVRACEQ